MNTEAAIRLNHVTKQFKNFMLDIPSLQIPKGFATALIGQNGAGGSYIITD